MKTSFYFVFWLAVYPLLELLDNSFIDNNGFLVALVIVIGLSVVLARLMPKTVAYERCAETYPILEEVYAGKVESFGKRLTRESVITLVSATYLTLSTIFIAIVTLAYGLGGWLELVIFGVIAVNAIGNFANFIKAKQTLKANPTQEQTMEIAEEVYKLNYADYYERRQATTYEGMFPERPKHFKTFQIFTIVIASIAILLGLTTAVEGILLMFGGESLAAGMLFLYGSLAVYYGIRDIITTSRIMK